MTSRGVFICRKDRKDVRLYHLTNGVISADILNVGGAIVKLMVPDKNGRLADVMLGFRELEEYTWNRAMQTASATRILRLTAKAMISCATTVKTAPSSAFTAAPNPGVWTCGTSSKRRRTNAI